MLEDELKNGEDKDLNSEKEEKEVYTLDEVKALKKEMSVNYEKGVSKVLKQKKNYESAMKEIPKIADNESYLIDLYNENPDVAQLILQTYYNGQDIESYKESISYKEDMSDPKIIKKMVEDQANKLLEAKIIEEKKRAFIDKLKMSDEEKENFENAFIERMQLKSFSINSLDKHLEKAYRENNDNTDSINEIIKQKTIADTLVVSNGSNTYKSKTTKESNVQKNSEYNKNFLKSRGIL